MHVHTVERRIMWGDLDSLGIVFYPRYYEWMDACGHLLFESLRLCSHHITRPSTKAASWRRFRHSSTMVQ